MSGQQQEKLRQNHDRQQETERNIQFIYEILAEQLKKQFENIRALDQKGSLLLGFIATMTTITLSVAESTSKGHSSLGFGLMVTGVGLLLVAMLFAVLELWVRSWQCPPRPRAFLYEQKDETWLQTMLQQCSNLVDAYEENEGRLRKKATLLKHCFVMLVLGTVSLVGGLLLM